MNGISDNLSFRDAPTLPVQNPMSPQNLVNLISLDMGVPLQDRMDLIDRVRNEPSFIRKMMYGSLGATIAFSVAHYMALSRPAQILLAIAGFGIGRLFMESGDRQSVLRYNDRLKAYKVT